MRGQLIPVRYFSDVVANVAIKLFVIKRKAFVCFTFTLSTTFSVLFVFRYEILTGMEEEVGDPNYRQLTSDVVTEFFPTLLWFFLEVNKKTKRTLWESQSSFRFPFNGLLRKNFSYKDHSTSIYGYKNPLLGIVQPLPPDDYN